MKKVKPEKITQSLIQSWCLKNSFWVHVIESKATFSKNLNRYLRGNAPEGFPDMVGITPCGLACYIELKARGKRSNLSPEQTSFLVKAIALGAFAVVTDSPENIEAIWRCWQSTNDKKHFLLTQVPKKHLAMALRSISSMDRKHLRAQDLGPLEG